MQDCDSCSRLMAQIPLYERWPNRPHLPIQQQAGHTKKISYLPSVDISVYKAGIKGFIYWINIESKARRRDLAWMWSLIQINWYLNIDIRKQDRLLFCLTSHTAGGWQHWVLCLAALPERLPSLEESRAVLSPGRTPGLAKSSRKPARIYLERKKGSQQRDGNVKDHIPNKNKDEI